MTETATIDLDQLQKLADAATPGPWTVSAENPPINHQPHYPDNGAIWVYADEDCDIHPIADCSCNHTCRMFEQEYNAAFIAAANPTTILALIARIRDLELRSATDG